MNRPTRFLVMFTPCVLFLSGALAVKQDWLYALLFGALGLWSYVVIALDLRRALASEANSASEFSDVDDVQLLRDALSLCKNALHDTPGGIQTLARLALLEPQLLARLMAAEINESKTER